MKESNNKNIEESHTNVPKSAIINELKEDSIKQWENEWENTTKGAKETLFS